MDSIKNLKEIAAYENLPWELTEEILSRVSPKSLVRFRVVCKRWKATLDDKNFIYKHKDRRPWIKEQQFVTRWISEPSFTFYGIGRLDSNGGSEESVYKTIWGSNTGWKIHDLASGTWKDVESTSSDTNQGENHPKVLHSPNGVLLNGTLFWIIFADPLYILCTFQFSSEEFYGYCKLPSGIHPSDVLVINFCKGDRFSVLKQCHITKKIEIWVTKNKVNVENGKDVVWMNFMTFSIPNFPGLVQTSYWQKPSYFIDSNERVVVCSCDETGKAWIYVMGRNKLISKVQLDSVVDPWPLHCTYFPSLVPVPRGQRDGAESEV
ncbi:hypothetical protein Bca4012_002007 [Brassica carinata]